MDSQNLIRLIFICFIFINLYSFYLFYRDKKAAIVHKWRVPESKLFLTALFGGAIGALFGMKFFSHKTKKAVFRVGLPFLLVINLIVYYFIFKYIAAM